MNNILSNKNIYLLEGSGTPLSQGVTGPTGSLYVNKSDGGLWTATTAGSSAGWTQTGASGPVDTLQSVIDAGNTWTNSGQVFIHSDDGFNNGRISIKDTVGNRSARLESWNTTTGATALIKADTGTFTISAFNSGGGGKYEIANNSGIRITDTVGSRGMYYAGDYGTTGPSTHGNRWIPDYGAVLSAIGASVGAYLPLAGGTMAGDIELGSNLISNGTTDFSIGTINPGSGRFTNGTQIMTIDTANGNIDYDSGAATTGTISMSSVTGFRTWTLPDETATLMGHWSVVPEAGTGFDIIHDGNLTIGGGNGITVTGNGAGLITIAMSSAAGIDSTAIHDNVAGEINAITSKATLTGADVILVEDSAAAFAKKKSTVSGIRITQSQITDNNVTVNYIPTYNGTIFTDSNIFYDSSIPNHTTSGIAINTLLADGTLTIGATVTGNGAKIIKQEIVNTATSGTLYGQLINLNRTGDAQWYGYQYNDTGVGNGSNRAIELNITNKTAGSHRGIVINLDTDGASTTKALEIVQGGTANDTWNYAVDIVNSTINAGTNTMGLYIAVYGAGNTNNIGAEFYAGSGVNNYAIMLEDGSEGVGKFLKSMTSDGKANWANITSADISDLAPQSVGATVDTADATITTIETIAIGPSSSVGIDATITGIATGSTEGVYARIEGGYGRVGTNTPFAFGAPTKAISDNSAGSPDVDFTISGNNVLVRVTGEGSKDYRWKVQYDLITRSF